MIGDAMRIQRTPCKRQPKFTILSDGVEIIAKSYDFKFAAFTDTYRVWSGRNLLFPKE